MISYKISYHAIVLSSYPHFVASSYHLKILSWHRLKILSSYLGRSPLPRVRWSRCQCVGKPEGSTGFDFSNCWTCLSYQRDRQVGNQVLICLIVGHVYHIGGIYRWEILISIQNVFAYFYTECLSVNIANRQVGNRIFILIWNNCWACLSINIVRQHR